MAVDISDDDFTWMLDDEPEPDWKARAEQAEAEAEHKRQLLAAEFVRVSQLEAERDRLLALLKKINDWSLSGGSFSQTRRYPGEEVRAALEAGR